MKNLSAFLPKVKNDRLLVFISGIGFSILVLFTYIKQPEFIQFYDLKLYDTLLKKTYTSQTTGVPVIIDLDEKSLQEYGQWPWPRYRVAMLLAKAQQLGALAIGMDIVFADYDQTSPKILQSQLKRDLMVDLEIGGIPEALMDNDLVLANFLSQGPYVLGYGFVTDNEGSPPENCNIHPVKTSILAGDEESTATGVYSATSAVCPIPELGKAALASGFFSIIPDPDGVLRRTPLLMNYQGAYYPSLSLATIMVATGIDQVILKTSYLGSESIKLGNTVIPVDEKGQILIKYRGKQKSFRYISAADILGDKLAPDALAGKIAFIGTSATGLKDIRTTPLDEVFPGVEVHATVADNILKADFYQRPDWTPGLEAALLIFAGLLTTVLLTWTRAAWSLAPFIICGVGAWLGAEYVLQTKGIYVSPLFCFIALTGNFGLLTLIKYWREEGHKKFLHSTFSNYLSPELIDEMFSSKTMPELGGELRNITAYFTDIQSFSTFSEKLSAHDLVELLNEYLSAMTDILIAEKGTLDKYEGDAIIAFFGAPMKLLDPALRACGVAVAMQNTLIGLRKKWQQDKIIPNDQHRNNLFPDEEWAPDDKWPKIVHDMKMRIGINSGEIVVGNMGSAMRMNYTMMGDAVNLAARLEAGAKQYGIYTAVSEMTLNQEYTDARGYARKVRDAVEVRFIDNIMVVGKSEPVKVYELCAMQGGLTAREEELFEIFAEGMDHYLNTRWDKAIACFKDSLKLERVPDGQTTPSQVFIDRCRAFMKNPPVAPGEKWDGVFRMTKK